MSWPLGHDHGLCSHASERFGRSEHKQWVRVDCIAGSVVHQIWFEDYPLAEDVDWKESQAGPEDLSKLLRVPLCMQDRNPRAPRSLIEVIFRQQKRSGVRGPSSQGHAPDEEVAASKVHDVTPRSDNAR